MKCPRPVGIRRLLPNAGHSLLAIGMLASAAALAQCPPGQAANPRTGACVGLPGGSPAPICPVGQIANGAGGCMQALQTVPAGQPGLQPPMQTVQPGTTPQTVVGSSPGTVAGPPAPVTPAGALNVPVPSRQLGGRLSPLTTAVPAPQNLRISASGPMVRTLTWDRMSGVSGYLVSRSNPPTNGAWSFLQVNGTPLSTESFAETSFMAPGSAYRVTALYPDGRQSAADLVYSNPPPFEVPAGFSAQQIGPGQVRLSWQPVNFAKGYRLFGSGQSPDGTLTPAVTQLVLSNLADGTYTWKLTADYGGAATGAGLPVASITLASVVSGRYLVTITGLRAIWASVDDLLSRDGQGDEVYVKAFVRNYDRRNGSVQMFTNRGTLTYGDINGQGTNRVQAGTQSASGGIRDGDPIPANSDPTERYGNPSDIAFPLRLWEGTLTNGVDTLVISPSLWEEDHSNQPFLLWAQQMNDITPALFQRPEIQNQLTKGSFAPILFGSSATPGLNGTAEGLAIAAAFADPTGHAMYVTSYQLAAKLFVGDSDRPIGLIPTGVADGGVALPNQMVVLTREIIEAALAPLPRGTPAIGPPSWPRMPKPGVMMISFRDGEHRNALSVAERPAVYEMYLKVERLP